MPSDTGGPESLVLQNGRLPGSGDCVDVTIEAGVIRRIGPRVPGRAGQAAVDLDGRWLIPGLWDNHVHFSQWAQIAQRLDLSAAASAAETVTLVRARVRQLRAGESLVGFGFRDGLWPDSPGRALLDAATGGIPVVLISGDLHSCWLNSAALARHGFAEHPTGLLREDDCYAVVGALGAVPDAVMDGWADSAARAAATRGVVGIVDLEMAWNPGVWQRRIGSGTDALRVETGVYTEHLERAISLGLRSGSEIEGTGGLATMGPFKVITDGSLNTRTAYCVDEYPGLAGRTGSHGLLTVPPDRLETLLRRAAENGLRSTVHAIGDRANTLALDAFAAVGCAGSIEHAQLLVDTDLARFAELGLVASVQPEHAMDDRDVADRHWAGRTERAFALRSLLNAGATLAFGSDAPVAPLDPWLSVAAAVGRTRDGREPWHAEQAISRAAALAASARGRQTVTEGEAADIAVCEFDPLAASVDDLRRMPVAATLLGGRFTHNTLQG